MTVTNLGWVPSLGLGFRPMRLSLLAKMGTGHTPDRTKPEYWQDCQIPWVTAADLSSRSRPFDPLMDTEQKVSSVGLAHSAAVLHPAGTVMLCRTASVGLIALIGVPMATTQAFVTWTPGPLLDSRYLMYVLYAMTPEWERLAYGSTHLTIYMPDLESVRIPICDVRMQRAIVEHLDRETSRLDALIETKRRMIDILEEQFTSLTEHVIWREVTRSGPLMYRTDQSRPIMYGIVLPGPDVPEGVPIVKGGDVAAKRLTPDQLNRTTREIERPYKRARLRSGDLVFAIRGGIGDVEIVPQLLADANITQDVARIAPSQGVDSSWLRLVLLTHTARAQVEERITGATIKGLNIWELKRIQIPMSDSTRQAEDLVVLQSAERRANTLIAALRRQIELAAEHRQALITAAVTGGMDLQKVAA